MPSASAELKRRRLRLAEAVTDVLGRYDIRLVLSVLILLSISPFKFVDQLWFVFATVFGVEAVARAYVLAVTPQKRASSSLGEIGMLSLDVLAWASFLPLAEATGLRFLRLVRFARLGLLVRYWGGTLKNLWHLLRREERARQIRLLLVGVVGLTLVSAALLHEMARTRDPHELGLEGPIGFFDLVWWSLRQLNDPGNLVADLDHLGIALLSLIMTMSGIVLFSFLVGIGTNVVEDLMAASREQPMGYRQHSVLINAGEHATFLLDEVAEHVRKHLRKPRWMVLGSAESDGTIEAEPRYRHIHYRRGTPYHAEDLAKVDATSARRFVVLGDPALPEPDSDTMSALLSIRQVNPSALVFAEVFEEKHATAVLAAGGDRSVVVATQHLLAIVLANLVARPEYDQLIEELLTVRGSELYSYLYPEHERAPVSAVGWPSGDSYGAFLAWAWEQHGCIPIGLASSIITRGGLRGPRDYDYVLDPNHSSSGAKLDIRGVVGLSSSLHGLASMARAFTASSDQWATVGGELDAAGPVEGPSIQLPDCRDGERPSHRERILLCRFVSRTPLLIEQLLRFVPGSTIYVMVDTDRERDAAERELQSSGASLARFGDPERYDAAPRGRFEARGDGSFGYVGPDGEEVPGTVHLMVADWSSRTELLEPSDNGYDAYTLDQIVIQTDPRGEGDPDARAVMALLKLTDVLRHPELGRRFEGGHTRRLEIVVEVVDPLKARLLERRFASSRVESDRLGKVSVVTTEWLRHVLMFQATVVPGFGDLFYELFSQKQTALRRLVFDLAEGGDDRRVAFGALVRHVYDVTGLTLIGYETTGSDERVDTVVLAPSPSDPGAHPRLSEVHALYALGSADLSGASSGDSQPVPGPAIADSEREGEPT